jgi:hypothetical protein
VSFRKCRMRFPEGIRRIVICLVVNAHPTILEDSLGLQM